MFQFKQFTIRHDLCAMKVGTDGVLLGAWADCSQAKTILDVGTGSGLIALMLAQRSNAKIDAIDIDEGAYQQTQVNACNSPFSDRIHIFHTSLQHFHLQPFVLRPSPFTPYDLIVSNPPYFSNSLVSPDKKRNIARHNNDLPFDALIKSTVSLLSPQGKFSVIIPIEAFESFDSLTQSNGLFLVRKTGVRPKPESAFKRLLLEYSLFPFSLETDELVIEISRHEYSDKYKNLTKDFYLKM